jgi:hypothetical protein
MSNSGSPLDSIPLTTTDLVKEIDPNTQAMSVQLNIEQSARLQEALRLGQVTPAQVEEWRAKTKTGPVVLPATVVGPDGTTTRSFALSDQEKLAVAGAMNRSAEIISPGSTVDPLRSQRVQNLSVGSTAANINERAG